MVAPLRQMGMFLVVPVGVADGWVGITGGPLSASVARPSEGKTFLISHSLKLLKFLTNNA